MSAHAIVYESRNRVTGTLCQTIDTRHPEASKLNLRRRVKAEETFRYAARCVDHNTVVFFQEHYPAGRAIAHPGDLEKSADGTQGWCPKCVQMHRDGKKVKGEKAEVTKPAAKAPSAPTRATKRTSDKRANRAAQRKANAAAKPGPVLTKSPTSLLAPGAKLTVSDDEGNVVEEHELVSAATE